MLAAELTTAKNEIALPLLKEVISIVNPIIYLKNKRDFSSCNAKTILFGIERLVFLGPKA